MKSLVILGDDKISGAVYRQISDSKNCHLYIDRSTNFSRVFRLLKKRVLSPALIIKMMICELTRKGSKPGKNLPSVNSNTELLKIISAYQPERLILFRAGLIIGKKIIKSGVPIFNIHAATVPEFGGIGSIDRALKSQVYHQYASMHIVTSRIDEGEVVDRFEYFLDPHVCYCENELRAYRAAQQLLLKAIAEK